jgi:hypothetical protein
VQARLQHATAPTFAAWALRDHARMSQRWTVRCGALSLVILLAGTVPALPQQLVTEDASIVERGACQIEAWHGPRATWVEPACQLIPRLEITAAVGWTGSPRTAKYLLEMKTFVRDVDDNGYGWGVMGGVEVEDWPSVPARAVQIAYALIPVSATFADDRVTLHANGGWRYESLDDEERARFRQHAFAWAVRADVELHPRLVALAELYDIHAGHPTWQAGLRARVTRDRLVVDLTFGDQLRRGRGERPGWSLGLGWTPPPIVR